MSAPVLLLRVAATWLLPGLGLLALPAGPTPHLTAYALHTALAVRAVRPDGMALVGVATVEEVSRPGTEAAVSQRALLLEMEAAETLPPDTEIWLSVRYL
ncbi:MAG: hypothetical protein M3Y54_03255 [Bacteroidota bacterium]|nr:hypothetical protein [Bacteroidota bacterium]